MTVHETKALEVFCRLCFRGDLTECGKVNLLEDLHRRYAFAEIKEHLPAHTVLTEYLGESRDAEGMP